MTGARERSKEVWSGGGRTTCAVEICSTVELISESEAELQLDERPRELELELEGRRGFAGRALTTAEGRRGANLEPAGFTQWEGETFGCGTVGRRRGRREYDGIPKGRDSTVALVRLGLRRSESAPEGGRKWKEHGQQRTSERRAFQGF